MAKVATKTRVTKKQVIAHRTRTVKDHSPVWEGCETWGADQFHRHFKRSMDYYRLESDIKTYKPVVVKWMESVGCTKADIAAFKKVKDSRIGTTMGAVAACLNRGMIPQRADFNQGRDTAAWLRAEIVNVLAAGKDDIDPEEAKASEAAKPAPAVKPDETKMSLSERIKMSRERAREGTKTDTRSVSERLRSAFGMASCGKVSSASSRADGIAQKGKTRGRMC